MGDCTSCIGAAEPPANNIEKGTTRMEGVSEHINSKTFVK
jgi:hypothetical protein